MTPHSIYDILYFLYYNHIKLYIQYLYISYPNYIFYYYNILHIFQIYNIVVICILNLKAYLYSNRIIIAFLPDLYIHAIFSSYNCILP